MSYDSNEELEVRKGRSGFWSDWFAEWCCLVDTLCALVTFNYYIPQLEQRFYKWWGYY